MYIRHRRGTTHRSRQNVRRTRLQGNNARLVSGFWHSRTLCTLTLCLDNLSVAPKRFFCNGDTVGCMIIVLTSKCYLELEPSPGDVIVLGAFFERDFA